MESEISLQKVQRLLDNFISIRDSEEMKKKESNNDYNKESENDYNIFSVLSNINNKEVLTHSPFIADLLDIRGKHQKKDLFYREFINQLGFNELGGKFQVANEQYFSIQTEKEIGDGRIDIFIQYNSPEKRFAIAIENKFFAHDQKGQLERYSNYLESEYGSDFLLLYLTLEGKLPDMNPDSIHCSIRKNRYEELEVKRLIKLISYQKHIVSLLQNTIPRIKNERIGLFIKQYLQLIKSTYKMSTQTEAKIPDEIYNYLIEDGNYHTASDLVQYLKITNEKLRTYFWNEVTGKLKEKTESFPTGNPIGLKFSTEIETFWFQISKEDWNNCIISGKHQSVGIYIKNEVVNSEKIVEATKRALIDLKENYPFGDNDPMIPQWICCKRFADRTYQKDLDNVEEILPGVRGTEIVRYADKIFSYIGKLIPICDKINEKLG